MASSITWYGHSCFLIADEGVSVLIDPFITGNSVCPISVAELPQVDFVLLTHDHGDHVGDAVQICNEHEAMCACVVGTGTALIQRGLREDLVPLGIGYNIGGTWTHKGVAATMVQAFHSSDSGVPVGYVVKMPNGFTVYHAGDTGLFADMEWIGRLYKPYVSLLPCGGVFTMDGIQAAEAARLLKSSFVIPMHWGTFPVLEPHPKVMEQHICQNGTGCELLVLQPGQPRVFLNE